MVTQIEALPDKTLARIATHLVHFRDIGALACTSRRFRALLETLYTPTMQLMRACARGDVAVVRTLLDDDECADPTTHEHYALRSSLEFGHVGIVRLLLDDGRVDPVAIDDDTIARACKNKHWLALDMILGPKPKFTSSKRERNERRLSRRFVEWRSRAKHRVDDAWRRTGNMTFVESCSALVATFFVYQLVPNGAKLPACGLVLLHLLYHVRKTGVPCLVQAYKLARDTSIVITVKAVFAPLFRKPEYKTD